MTADSMHRFHTTKTHTKKKKTKLKGNGQLGPVV